MCIRHRWRVKEKREWLKEQPDTIIAYKIMKIEKNYRTGITRLYPPCIGREPYKRKNRVRKAEHRKDLTYYKDTCQATSYYAYFHLFLNKNDAREWVGKPMGSIFRLVECKVPKHMITDIGVQDTYPTIVTKGFDIVGQDEFLD